MYVFYFCLLFRLKVNAHSPTLLHIIITTQRIALHYGSISIDLSVHHFLPQITIWIYLLLCIAGICTVSTHTLAIRIRVECVQRKPTNSADAWTQQWFRNTEWAPREQRDLLSINTTHCLWVNHFSSRFRDVAGLNWFCVVYALTTVFFSLLTPSLWPSSLLIVQKTATWPKAK